jgi:hypothetical protein
MDRLDSANVARVVARMDAIAAAQARPIAVTDSVHWRFPLFWVNSPMGAGLDLSIGVIGTGASFIWLLLDTPRRLMASRDTALSVPAGSN